MQSIGLRLGVALAAFLFGLALDVFVNTSTLVEKALTYPVKAVDRVLGPQIEVPERRMPLEVSGPSQITFERIQPSCFGCPIRRIVLRSTGSEGRYGDAIVTELDESTGHERNGTLDSYYYRNLLKFIVSQGYFAMNDEYFTGTIDGSVVTSSVKVGDRYKSVCTASEDKVPPALWGIHYAIEGVLNHVSWEAEARP